MANKKKNYNENTLKDLGLISEEIAKLLKEKNFSVRGLAQKCDISVNSIRSVLEGKTANIATYDEVARALDSSLINIVMSLATPKEDTEEAERDTDQDPVNEEVAEAPTSFPGQDPMV